MSHGPFRMYHSKPSDTFGNAATRINQAEAFKMRHKTTSAVIGAAAALSIAGIAQAATEVRWWHAMGGKLGEKVVEIADGFNASQSDYKIMPVYLSLIHI